MKLFSSQSGVALMNAVFVIAFTVMFAQVSSLLITRYKKNFPADGSRVSLLEQKRGRDYLAKQVQLAILNPQLLFLSATYGTSHHPYNRTSDVLQNRSFYNCLFRNPATPCNGNAAAATLGRVAPFRPAGGGAGDSSQNGYRFLLIKDTQDCQQDFSRDQCIIGGDTNVGYNFRGQQGVLSPLFPLEVRVYFTPSCTANENETEADRNAACDFARRINVAYEIVHRRFDAGGNVLPSPQTGRLGVYPRRLSYQTMPTYLITGQQCNTGAFVKGYTRDGNLDCECRAPFRATGNRDAEGVLCELDCPPGTFAQGLLADGRPECVGRTTVGAGTTNLATREWSETLCLSSEPSGCDGNSLVDCLDDNQGHIANGWMTQAIPTCDTRTALPEQEGSQETDEAMRIGLVVAGAVVGAIIGYFTGYGVIAIVLGGIFGGAVGEWVAGLFDDRDYHIQPTHPLVACTWDITCRAYVNPDA